jgi:ribosomal protein S18 acetylase RimI-like enzyme
MPYITLIDANPTAPEAQLCLRAYYDLLLEKIPALTADMLTLPLPDPEAYCAPKGAFLLAMQGTTPLGCVSLRPLDPQTAEVKRLWVAPQARGMGLARRLMTALESRARDLGYTGLKLDSNSNLPEAIGLYRRDGWTDCPAYTGFPADIWLAKTL